MFLPKSTGAVSSLVTPVRSGILGNFPVCNPSKGLSERKFGKNLPSLPPSMQGAGPSSPVSPARTPSVASLSSYKIKKAIVVVVVAE